MLDRKPSNLTPGKIFGSIQNFGPVEHGPTSMPRPTFPYRAGHFWSAQSALRTVHTRASPPRSRWGELFPVPVRTATEPDHQFIQLCGISLSPFTTSPVYSHSFITTSPQRCSCQKIFAVIRYVSLLNYSDLPRASFSLISKGKVSGG